MRNIIYIFIVCALSGLCSLHAESPLEKINTSKAPAVYDVTNPVDYLKSIKKSQAIAVDIKQTKKLLFVSGQVALDPETGEELESDIRMATKRTMDNIEAILKEAGSDWKYVARVDVFLRDLNDWEGMNEVYGTYFPNGIFPARQTVGVNMVNRIEISCVAIVPVD